jgi:hypothetical protein
MFHQLSFMKTKMTVFWVVAPCSLVEVYQRFRGPCCLHHQGDHRPDDGGSKKTAIFVLTAVRTSNPTFMKTVEEIAMLLFLMHSKYLRNPT